MYGDLARRQTRAPGGVCVTIERLEPTPPRELGQSPLLDGMERRDSFGMEFLKFLGSGAVGVVGGVIAAIGAVVVFFVAVLFIIIGNGQDPDELGRVLETMQAGGELDSLGMTIGALAFLAVVNTIFMVLIVLLASLIRKRPFFANITSARRFRWGHLAAGLVAYGVMFAVLIGVEAAFFGFELKWPVLDLTDNAGEVALLVSVVTIGFIIAAFAEEILFRGWLLRETAVFTRRVWVLLFINGVLFSAIHVNPTTWAMDPNAFVARAAMGVLFCYMALRFGGIEFATGAHAANNIMLTLAVQPLALSDPAPEPVQVSLMLESVVLLAMGLGVTEIAARLMRGRRPELSLKG